MKTVFSNQQVCHVWAQQTQSHGKSGSIFFRDSMIFSYGEHYMLAKIHTYKGEKFALVNSTDTTMTTKTKHKPAVRSALRGLMPSFYVKDPSDVKSAVKDVDAYAAANLTQALKTLKVQSKDDIKHNFALIHEGYKEANKLRKILGRAEKWPSKKAIKQVQTHLDKRLARYHELNTPEMLAKREAAKAIQKAAQDRAVMAERAIGIQRFRQGERPNLYGLPYDLLRVQGEAVITSRGAEVPLHEAKRLLSAIRAGANVIGAQCGSFTVQAIYPVLPDDKQIQIGCHKILLSEAVNVLGAL